MTKMVKKLPFYYEFGNLSGNDDRNGKKLLISCEFGNLSGKDDQNGKKTADFLRIWKSFAKTIRNWLKKC